MGILTTDINQFYLSGGAGNVDVAASLGGAISASVIVSDALHNLFDLVSSEESSTGDVEFKCFYVKNNHATLTLQNPKIWINSNTVNVDTVLDIGAGPSLVSGVEQTIVNESTVPDGVVFTRPTSKAAGISIGNLIPGATKAIWIRRTVNTGSLAVNNDNATIGFGGDTAA